MASTFDQMAESSEQPEFERKQAEEPLQRGETNFRELTEFLPQVAFEMDLSGNRAFGN
jgi:hypothetical protein